MPSAYEWAVLRAVPRVDRSEFVNVGVVVYCQTLDFLEARIAPDLGRVIALDPDVDLDGVRAVISKAYVRCAQARSPPARTAGAEPASGSGGSPPRAAPWSRCPPCTPGSRRLLPMS